MKAFFSILLSFLLVGCGKDEKSSIDSTTPTATTPRAASLPKTIESFRNLSPETLRSMLAANIRKGSGLETRSAERCLEEDNRSEIRELCLFWWAFNRSHSPQLEKALAEGGRTSTLLAIATVRHENAMQFIDFNSFTELLERIKSQPRWLQIRAMRLWTASKLPIHSERAKPLLEFSQTSYEAPPLEVRESLLLHQVLGESNGQAVLESFCSLDVLGISRTRCWRFLSSVDPVIDPTFFLESMKVFIPNAFDADWIFFQRSFPDRSLTNLNIK